MDPRGQAMPTHPDLPRVCEVRPSPPSLARRTDPGTSRRVPYAASPYGTRRSVSNAQRGLTVALPEERAPSPVQ